MAELLDSYRRSAWLQAVVNRIGYHFAIVPWVLYERPGRAPNGKRFNTKRFQRTSGDFHFKSVSSALRLGQLQEIDSHPLLDLIDNPNTEMGGVAFRELCSKFLDFTGECAQLVVRDEFGIPYQLWPLSPTWVTRIPSDDKPSFELSVFGVNMEIDRKHVIFIKRPELVNPYARGSGIGASLDDTIDIDDYAHKFLKGFYFNGARPDMIISLPGASEEVIADFQQKFENQTRGATRAHRTFFADEEIKVDELRNDKGAEQSLPILNYVRDTLISVYGVPPEIMGVLGSSNRATINAAMTIFARETLMPRLELVKSEWQRQLVPLFDENLLLSFANPVPEDDDFRLNVARAAPWSLSAREWRQLGGWNTADDRDVDVHMVPMGLNPTDDLSVPILAPGQPGIGGVPGGGAANAPSGGAAGELPETAPAAAPEDEEDPESLKSLVADLVAKELRRKAADDPEALADSVLEAFDPDYLTDELDPAWKESVAGWADGVLDELNVDARFDLQNPRVKKHLQEFRGRMSIVNETTEASVRRQLVEGMRAVEGYEDLAARVQGVMGGNRAHAEKVARTETTRSSNFASEAAYRQSGVIPRKEWIPTVSDDRTRDEHLALNKEIVAIDEPFEINGNPADFPGGFGIAELDINCRCTVAPVVDDVDETRSADARVAFWKAKDAAQQPWQKKAEAAFLRAWAKQSKPILKRLASLV